MVGAMEFIKKGLMVSCARRVQTEDNKPIKSMTFFMVQFF